MADASGRSESLSLARQNSVFVGTRFLARILLIALLQAAVWRKRAGHLM